MHGGTPGAAMLRPKAPHLMRSARRGTAQDRVLGTMPTESAGPAWRARAAHPHSGATPEPGAPRSPPACQNKPLRLQQDMLIDTTNTAAYVFQQRQKAIFRSACHGVMIP